MSHNSKLETISELLNHKLLDAETAKQFLLDCEKSLRKKNMSVNNIGVGSTTHFYAQGDETRCPHCYKNTLIKIGILTLSNNTQQDTHRCTSCGKLSSVTGGGIQGLVTEAANAIQGSAGFVSVSTTSGTLATNIGQVSSPVSTYGYASSGSAFQNDVSLDSNTKGKFDQMNSNLSNISGSMWTLVTEMQNLSKTVKDLAQQNKDLMEKLATDPLNGIRKAVSSFNLE